MTDFSNILLVSDYDRTMTAFDGTIPQANLDAVAEFIGRGGAFTIATGRSKPMFRRHLAKLQINAPVILANGAAVWEPETERVEVRHSMPEGWQPAVRAIHGQFPALRMELQGTHAHYCFGRDELRDGYIRKNGFEPIYSGWDDIDDTILNVSFYAPFMDLGHARPADTAPAEARVFDRLEAVITAEYGTLFDVIRSMPRMAELMPRGCGKGGAARWLADRLGRRLLCCAGDAPNDLDMLDEADLAFIPTSADPAILGRGYTETASCDDGTIAAVVDRLRKS